MLDIDDFKTVNDTFGHDVGDSVLRELSGLVTDNIRSLDSFYRIGGEQFSILAPHTDADQAAYLAEHIREKIKKRSFERVGAVTVSLGVTSYNDKESSDDFRKRADVALYDSKNSGKNRVSIKKPA